MVKALPRGMSERAFRAVADAATVRNGRGVQQLRTNLRRVVGPEMSELRMDGLVGEALRSYSRYWLETFLLESMDHHAVADTIAQHLTGGEHVAAAVERGDGLILALPHSGNWDASGTWYIDRYGPFTTVAERLKPESVFDRFVAYRESMGMEVIALTGGERPPTTVLAERLKAGGTICLLADRDLSRNGIEVEFFGETARMPGGPALLAATTGATLCPVVPYFTENGWGLDFGPPIELQGERLRERVRTGTQRIADWFAAGIARHPADWHMLQRLWLADLPPREPVTTAGASAE
jgi:KDO2-lipid IV(A) lauroyltransferase